MNGKWVLSHGIHRGTVTSRDVGQDEEYETREEAINALKRHKQFYSSIGYRIWFSQVVSPDGTVEQLEGNPYY